MSQNKERLKIRKIANIISGMTLFLIFFSILFIVLYDSSYQERKAINGGVIVEAEFIDIDSRTSFFGGKETWHLEYQYIDENGVRYQGVAGPTLDSMEEAKQYIGKKVDIYIDGNSHSIEVGQTPSDRKWLVIAIIFIILTVTAIAVYFRLRAVYKRMKAEEITGEENYLGEEATTELQNRDIVEDTAIEKVSKKRMKEKTELRKTANSILCTALVLLIFVSASILLYYQSTLQRNAMEGGVIVEAKIVGVRSCSSPSSGVHWHLEYRYIDENGVRYSGTSGPLFNYIEEAERHIGEKVDIYIDGKGNSIEVGSTPADKALIAVFVVLIIIVLIAIAVYFKLLAVDKRNLRAKEVIDEANSPSEYGENPQEAMTSEPIAEIQKEEITTDTAIEDVSNIEE